MSQNIIDITDDNFNQEVLQSEKLVLADFWAPWCGPCRQLTPIIEEFASEYQNKIKVFKKYIKLFFKHLLLIFSIKALLKIL